MKILSSIRTNLLSAFAVLALASMTPAITGCTPAQKQTALQVITQIDQKLPEVTAAADTVAATLAVLLPADAALIAPADIAFDTLAEVLQGLCESYLANPDATTLSQIQTAIGNLEANVTTSVLAAARITNPASQALAIAALKTLLTVVTIVFAMISPTMSSAQLQELRAGGKIQLARLRPYMDDGRLRAFAVEQGSPAWLAGYEVDRAFAQAAAEGF